jgi:endogenous inhibitor of DNA gyrase (YacG/DUF329 family)
VDLHRWLSGTYTILGDVEEADVSSPDDSER